MTLVKGVLKTALKQAFKDGEDAAKLEGATADSIRDKVCDTMAQAILDFIKSGTVVVASGIPVTTIGSATTQAGATTAAGNGTIK